MHTRRTLQLDKISWDITLDGVGRIALTNDAMATAQNVSNKARLFTEDAYFMQDKGIPHFIIELGKRGNTALLRSYLHKSALSVSDVKEVLSVDIISLDPETRTLTGNIQFTTKEGNNGTLRASL